MAIFKQTPEQQPRTVEMNKEKQAVPAATHDGVISIVGAGMRVIGDCETEGTIRIEGRVEGSVRAGKAVVVGKDGAVKGDIVTQDAVIGGKVSGTVTAESRLELQASCSVDGEIRARRIQLEEGGQVNGNIFTGDVKAVKKGSEPTPLPPAAGKESKETRVAG